MRLFSRCDFHPLRLGRDLRTETAYTQLMVNNGFCGFSSLVVTLRLMKYHGLFCFFLSFCRGISLPEKSDLFFLFDSYEFFSKACIILVDQNG